MPTRHASPAVPVAGRFALRLARDPWPLAAGAGGLVVATPLPGGVSPPPPPPPGRRPCEGPLILPRAVPAYVIGFVFRGLFDYTGPVQSGLRRVFGPGIWFPDIASFGGVVLVMTLVFYPYVYLLARTAFLEQSETTLEAARALGARRTTVFWRIAPPPAPPAPVAGPLPPVVVAPAG